MNYLAHTHLSFGKPAWIVGNYLADIIKGREALAALPPEVQEGVYLHRAIDTFTDAHPLVAQARERLRPFQGRYTPVTLDIAYDFVLARHWQQLADRPLEEVAREAYQAYRDYQPLFPEAAWRRISSMMQHNYLLGYSSEQGLRYTFIRMAERAKFPNQFLSAADDFIRDLPAYEAEFIRFYPELLAEARRTMSL
jgi:acyl carrier protein phosphodiesterase